MRAVLWTLWEHAPEPLRRLLRPALAPLRRRRRVHTPLPPGWEPRELPAEAVELDTDVGTLWFDGADEHVTPWVRSQGVWEADVGKLLARTLGPGAVFVDVGANVGYHSVAAARLVGAGGRVYAVEPMPWTLALLRANLARHAPAAIVLPVAAGAAAASVRLALDPRHRSGASMAAEGVEVEAAPLDELLPEVAVDMLKVDVEGAEPLVLRGARRLLERSPGLLAVVEFRDAPHAGGETPADVLAFYESLGFELCLLRRDGTPEPAAAAAVLARGRRSETLNLVLRRRPTQGPQ